MRFEVGIDPQSLCYGFVNEIMAHAWSDGGPGITRLGCTYETKVWLILILMITKQGLELMIIFQV